MLFFKKKKKKEEAEEKAEEPAEEEDPNAEPEVPVAAAPERPQPTAADASVGKLTADVEKLKAQFSTFYELQKASNERFTNINEQIGGLRTMMLDKDKDFQRLEAHSTQAIDLVKTVQPDKFMVDLRKMDSKIEALKANIESNETVIKNSMRELKEMRNKMMVFKGMEQVIKMNDDVKKELLEIKKLQAVVERHGDKVETIFSEMQKKFGDFIRTGDMVKDLDKGFKQISSEFDSIKVKLSDFGSKKEVENLIAKFDDFEKYVSNIVTLLDKRFGKLDKELRFQLDAKYADAEKLLKGFETLAMRTPDLDKYFNLLSEEAKAAAEKEKKKPEVEKIKELGADEKVKVEPEETMKEKVASAVGDVQEKVKGALKAKS